MNGPDVASLLLRLVLGVVMLAHGWNHAFRGGRLEGTARWFESIGIKPGWLHARLATFTELAVGPMLLLGLLTPLAAAGVVGTMGVALVANHLRNGFFIFRPGEGYEYVLTLVVTAVGLAALGGGEASLDHALDLADDLAGGDMALLALLVGGGGAGLVLATCWRRPPKAADAS
ncbi:MAG: DoxX family protein [Acidimicrobiia bacterium]